MYDVGLRSLKVNTEVYEMSGGELSYVRWVVEIRWAEISD